METNFTLRNFFSIVSAIVTGVIGFKLSSAPLYKIILSFFLILLAVYFFLDFTNLGKIYNSAPIVAELTLYLFPTAIVSLTLFIAKSAFSTQLSLKLILVFSLLYLLLLWPIAQHARRKIEEDKSKLERNSGKEKDIMLIAMFLHPDIEKDKITKAANMIATEQDRQRRQRQKGQEYSMDPHRKKHIERYEETFAKTLSKGLFSISIIIILFFFVITSSIFSYFISNNLLSSLRPVFLLVMFLPLHYLTSSFITYQTKKNSFLDVYITDKLFFRKHILYGYLLTFLLILPIRNTADLIVFLSLLIIIGMFLQKLTIYTTLSISEKYIYKKLKKKHKDDFLLTTKEEAEEKFIKNIENCKNNQSKLFYRVYSKFFGAIIIPLLLFVKKLLTNKN